MEVVKGHLISFCRRLCSCCNWESGVVQSFCKDSRVSRCAFELRPASSTPSVTHPGFLYVLPRTSASRTSPEVQISLLPAGASTPTTPLLFLCMKRENEDLTLSLIVKNWKFQLSVVFVLFYLSLSSLRWSTFSSLRRSFRIFLFFSLSVCLFVPGCVCWETIEHNNSLMNPVSCGLVSERCF